MKPRQLRTLHMLQEDFWCSAGQSVIIGRDKPLVRVRTEKRDAADDIDVGSCAAGHH
jgi:hypothetical protein